MGLVLIQADGEHTLVRRRGRFSVPADMVKSSVHMEAAIRKAQEQMIAGLAKRGYEYVDHGFELQGPLPHLDVSEDATPDPDWMQAPDPRDRDRWEEWERVEKARVARDPTVGTEYVDFRLIATFKRRRGRWFRRAGSFVEHKEELWLPR